MIEKGQLSQISRDGVAAIQSSNLSGPQQPSMAEGALDSQHPQQQPSMAEGALDSQHPQQQPSMAEGALDSQHPQQQPSMAEGALDSQHPQQQPSMAEGALDSQHPQQQPSMAEGALDSQHPQQQPSMAEGALDSQHPQQQPSMAEGALDSQHPQQQPSMAEGALDSQHPQQQPSMAEGALDSQHPQQQPSMAEGALDSQHPQQQPSMAEGALDSQHPQQQPSMAEGALDSQHPQQQPSMAEGALDSQHPQQQPSMAEGALDSQHPQQQPSMAEGALDSQHPQQQPSMAEGALDSQHPQQQPSMAEGALDSQHPQQQPSMAEGALDSQHPQQQPSMAEGALDSQHPQQQPSMAEGALDSQHPQQQPSMAEGALDSQHPQQQPSMAEGALDSQHPQQQPSMAEGALDSQHPQQQPSMAEGALDSQHPQQQPSMAEGALDSQHPQQQPSMAEGALDSQHPQQQPSMAEGALDSQHPQQQPSMAEGALDSQHPQQQPSMAEGALDSQHPQQQPSMAEGALDSQHPQQQPSMAEGALDSQHPQQQPSMAEGALDSQHPQQQPSMAEGALDSQHPQQQPSMAEGALDSQHPQQQPSMAEGALDSQHPQQQPSMAEGALDSQHPQQQPSMAEGALDSQHPQQQPSMAEGALDSQHPQQQPSMAEGALDSQHPQQQPSMAEGALDRTQEEVANSSEDSIVNDSDDDLINNKENARDHSDNEDEFQDDTLIEEQESDDGNMQTFNYEGNEDMFQDEQDAIIDDEDELVNDKQESEQVMQKKQNASKSGKLALRDYQNLLFKNSLNKNSIIYLPTGSGKTLVAIASMYYYLCREGDNKKIVFLANTIQLVKQQAESIKYNLLRIIEHQELAKNLRGSEHTGNITWNKEQMQSRVCCIHGEKSEELGQSRRKRIEGELTAKKEILAQFKKGTIFIMISQMFLNSLRRGYIKITDFSFIVLDECHHCQGQHPYASIMKEFYFDRKAHAHNSLDHYDNGEVLPKIMGLTASPIAHPSLNQDELKKQLKKLCQNLDSMFTYYKTNKIKSETDIKVEKIVESEEKEEYPYLLDHFQKHRDHKEAYDKIQFNMPVYFKCVKQVLDCISKDYEDKLSIQDNARSISDVELLLFYDIKESLVVKLRDIWLELGEYPFLIAYRDLLGQLNKVNLKTERNKQILNEVIEILKRYFKEFSSLFGKCDRKFFSAKLIRLIELLQSSSKEEEIPGTSPPKPIPKDMVLVFAAKRRTVKYLEETLKDYKNTLNQEEKKNFECRGVTGYSSKSYSNFNKNELIYEADPSSERFYAELQIKYNEHLQKMKDEQRLANRNSQGESENLTNEMKKMKNVKCGKLLLEVEEKYIHQINKINDFKKKKFRVLITTSVTEEGFDMPECNIVISFDQPNSLKSYIQIKGRARKQNSKYYIFTAEKNYQEMVRKVSIFDDTIRITSEIAISSFSRKDNEENQFLEKFQKDEGYEKAKILSTGALLNTNYALEILKTYCASLRQPNKPLFYLVKTPNIANRCIIGFPPTSPTDKPFIVGKPFASITKAVKSASFEAVKYLYKEKYIKGDLRPKRYQQLQDQKQIQKFDDIPFTKINEQYKQIFEQNVQVKIEDINNENIHKKFIRLYFKRLSVASLDFLSINPEFGQHRPIFQTNCFPFQVFMISFSNTQNFGFMQSNSKSQEVGMLTCFGQEHAKSVFQGYEYNFEENSRQGFNFKLVKPQLMLNKAEYIRLKNVHKFLVAAVLQKEHHYYSELAETAPVKPSWVSQIKKFKQQFEEDKEREFHPILVLLKRKNDNYEVDELCNCKIEQHQKVFTDVYRYHNVSSRGETIHQKFSHDLSDSIKDLQSELNASDKDDNFMVQRIDRELCFHKCLIVGKLEYSEELDVNTKKKQTLKSKHSKLLKMFKHPSEKIKLVVEVNLWKNYRKQKKIELFQRGSSLIQKESLPNRYLLEQFLLYPLSPTTLFKVSLALEFGFKAYHEYSLAFRFKNIELQQLIEKKIPKAHKESNLRWVAYPSVILEHQNELFNYLAANGNSEYLRKLGKSHDKASTFKKPSFDLSLSKISMVEDSIMKDSHNMTNNSQILNSSELNLSTLNDNSNFLQPEKSNYEQATSDLEISEVLKVLTSRMYKFNNADNYESYEFIGDVVLKMLSTVQIFLQNPSAEESSLHIGRANIICNANLHRKAILQQFFKYILAGKYNEQPPPYKLINHYEDELEYFEDTKIQVFNKSSLLEGFQYIPGKVHADVIQALIGAFFLKRRSLDDCQLLLYCLDILKKPSLDIHFNLDASTSLPLPKQFSEFEERIEYHFSNKGLLIQAFTHSSFRPIIDNAINKNNLEAILQETQTVKGVSSFMNNSKINNEIGSRAPFSETYYERLEFLGDSILDLIVVEYLYEKYGSKDEGSLTLLKQAGVSNKSLGMIAMRYGMHELLLIEHSDADRVMGEFRKIQSDFDKYVNNPQNLIEMKMNSIKILGDVFEALVGAIFIDLQMDYRKTEAVIMRIMRDFLAHFTEIENSKNNNGGGFQEYLEKNNYQNCKIKKDTNTEIENGMYRWLLVDKVGHIIKDVWEVNEKKARETFEQNYHRAK